MALRNTLAEVTEFVRDEARLSTNSSRGTDHLTHIQQLIRRHHETLAQGFEWEHLKVKRNDAAARKVLSAGSRYYNWPASLDPERVTGAWVKFGGTWEPLGYGIGPQEYSVYDPDEDQRTDPVQKWAFHDHAQFEVWPIPLTNGSAGDNGEVAFEGKKVISLLAATTDRLDVDGILVALYCAAEILAENGQKSAAEIKGAAAAARYRTLTGTMASQRRFTIGLGIVGEGGPKVRHPIYINSTG